MSTSTVTVRPMPALGKGVRRLEVSCEHATTGMTWVNARRGIQLDEYDVAKIALVRHWAEEGCQCHAAAWRKYWGTAPGELPYWGAFAPGRN